MFGSGLYTLNKYQIAERGARMTRRVDREYREYLREEQRSQPGCPAREVVLDQRGQATDMERPRQISCLPPLVSIDECRIGGSQGSCCDG